MVDPVGDPQRRFAACQTLSDPKGACCPQALPVVAFDRSQVLSAPRDKPCGFHDRLTGVKSTSRKPMGQ
jgi:hypothetical protein